MSGNAEVYIQLEGPHAPEALVFCRADDTDAQVEPRKHMRIIGRRHLRAEPVFTHAAVASQSWMQERRSMNEAPYTTLA